jgi:hypothetical protein
LVNIPLKNNAIMTYVVLNPSSEVFDLSKRCQLRNLISQFLNTQGETQDYHVYPYDNSSILNFERPLKVVVKDDLPITSQFVEYLNNSGIPAISIPIDESNNTEDIYLGRTITDKQFFFNLLVFEPVDEWFENFPEGKRLIEAYKYNSEAQWNNAENRFKRWAYDQAYYVPAVRTVRHVNIPDKFINVKGGEYSIVKFNHFLVRGEY